MKNIFITFLAICLCIFISGITLCQKATASHPSNEYTQTDHGKERILSYDATVQINSDSSIDVTETISIVARGHSIRLGLERDFPSFYYMGRKKVETPTKVLSVLRNGHPEHFWTEKIRDGQRLFIGAEEDTPENRLPPGIHTYTIHWAGQNHIRGFEKFDELYFNAIGHEWFFDIDEACARIYLAKDTKTIQAAAYIGKTGSTEKAGSLKIEDDLVAANAGRALHPGEGLTVAVAFNKGVLIPAQTVAPYESFIMRVLDANTFLTLENITQLLTLAALLIYYSLVWLYHGKDPDLGPIMPIYAPEPGMTIPLAGALLNINQQNIFAAAVVEQAAKGNLLISDKALEKTGQLQDKKTTQPTPKNNDPGNFKNSMLVDDNNFWQAALKKAPFRLDAYSPQLSTVFNAFARRVHSLKKQFTKSNRRFIFLGLLLHMAGLFLFSLDTEGFFILFGNTLLIAFYAGFLWLILAKSPMRLLVIIFYLFIVFHFYQMETAIVQGFLPDIAHNTGKIIFYLALNIILMACHIIFYKFMEKPTLAGSKLIASLMGLRMFIATTDEHRFKLMTPDVFEKNLPYAILFGLEKKWLDEFKHLSPDYNPTWYRGKSENFSKTLSSSLARGIAEGTTAPPSKGSSGWSGGRSSGSGGGGRSGGGSGGGGGRGR